MNFVRNYLEEIVEISRKLSVEKIEQLVFELVELKSRSGRLFVLGVGGSAANASHAVNDFRKLTNIESYAPTDNISELTARTNDEGWESTFINWLKISNLNSNDAIFVLSVGGGDIERKVSVNLIYAIQYAKEVNSKVLSIVGREIGFAQSNSDVCVTVPNINRDLITPHSESFQSVIWHLIVSHPLLKANKTTW